MDHAKLAAILTQEFLDTLLPIEKTDRFFEALLGDAEDGAYDIKLELLSLNGKRIVLAFNLMKRPGKCLVCSLTYGLPNVFTRHPVIDLKGIVKRIQDEIQDEGLTIKNWHLGETEENSTSLHVIPFYLDLE